MSAAFPGHLEKRFELGNADRGKGYTGRYAPSPSGPLHLGNIRTALISWLKARTAEGKWLLRLDDLDKPRNRVGAVESIQNDLLWLGLEWDGPVIFQSRRKGIYNSVLAALRKQGKLYPCCCSRRILAKVFAEESQLQIYPGTCRDLRISWGKTDERLPSWRLKVSKQNASKCGDVLLRRADGFIAYHLATVVDELTLGITEVVRGADLAIALPSQLAVVEALDQEPIQYLHVPLLLDSKGRKLAKRDGSSSLEALRKKGQSASEVIGSLASSLGLVPNGSEISVLELLTDLKNNKDKINSIFLP